MNCFKSLKTIAMAMLMLAIAQGVQAQSPAHITGKVKNFTGGKVLFNSNANRENSMEITVAEDGSFEFTYDKEPTDGYIFFDNDHLATFIYLEKGMKADLQMSIDDVVVDGKPSKNLSVAYSGDNKECTDYLNKTQGYLLLNATYDWSWERLDTISFAEYREGWRETVDRERHEIIAIPNVNFRTMMLERMEEMYNHYLFRFALGKGKKDEKFLTWINSLDRNNPNDLETAASYHRWYRGDYKDKYGKSFAGYLKCLDDEFTCQQIKDMFAADQANGIMEDAKAENKEEVLKAFEAYCSDKKLIDEVRETYEHYKNVKIGSPFVHFTMSDTKGKTVAIESLRGKFTYIDCWATWCGPCCAEIPYMEKLYDHYKKDKRIQLVSISLDSNKKKWLEKLAADKPGWKQYIVPENFESPLCDAYGINGIPRFMMIDPKGNIISIDAPRPSSEGIIKWIDEQMNK